MAWSLIGAIFSINHRFNHETTVPRQAVEALATGGADTGAKDSLLQSTWVGLLFLGFLCVLQCSNASSGPSKVATYWTTALLSYFLCPILMGVRSFRRLHHSDASANINSAKCSFLCRIHRNTLPSSHHPHYPGRSAGRHSELVHCGIKRKGPVRPHGSHGLWVGCCATPLLELGESLHALARSVR